MSTTPSYATAFYFGGIVISVAAAAQMDNQGNLHYRMYVMSSGAAGLFGYLMAGIVFAEGE